MPFPIAAAVGAAARVIGPRLLTTTTRAARSKVGKRVVQGMAFKAGMDVMGAANKKMTDTPKSPAVMTEYSQ